MDNKRNALYDNVKFFLICCVVLGHLGNKFAGKSSIVASAQFWVYLFHMPAFVFLAGLFSKRTVNESRWRRFVPYVFLYLFMEASEFLVDVINKGYAKAKIDILHEDGVPWFALALFWWHLICVLVKKLNSKYVFMISLVLALASGYFSFINSFLVVQRTIIFFPFFYLGYIIDSEKLETLLSKKHIKIIALLVVLATIYVSFAFYDNIGFWRMLFRGKKPYSEIGSNLNSAYGFVWRIIAYLISSVLTLSVIALTPSKNCYISKLGQRTLSVYVFHYILITLILGQLPSIKRWMNSDPVSIKCLIAMIIIVLFTSTKPFVFITDLITKYPGNKKMKE